MLAVAETGQRQGDPRAARGRTCRWPSTTSATAGAIRAQEGGLSQIDADTVAHHRHEPLGVVGQIIVLPPHGV